MPFALWRYISLSFTELDTCWNSLCFEVYFCMKYAEIKCVYYEHKICLVSRIGYWHDTVVCPSVCPTISLRCCALCLNDTYYNKSV